MDFLTCAGQLRSVKTPHRPAANDGDLQGGERSSGGLEQWGDEKLERGRAGPSVHYSTTPSLQFHHLGRLTWRRGWCLSRLWRRGTLRPAWPESESVRRWPDCDRCERRG